MKPRFTALVLFVLLGVMILSACGGAAPAATEAYAIDEPAVMMEAPVAAQDSGEANLAKEESAPSSNPGAGPVYNIGETTENAAFTANHMIIKNADIKLQVEDSDVAIDRATQVIGDVGGYIISSRVWYQPWTDGENYKYGTITVGVPVDQFERTLSRLRGLAVKVLDETASGEDVSNQFVDLQSQVASLEATRDRIKSFLDEAKTVDEALRINAELANVETQIEQLKGQMNYLQDRSAFSTITINFEPVLPEELTPTPTPSPTPTAWNPGETFKDAKHTATIVYQGIVDILIWVVVLFGLPALIIWGLWKLFTRKPKNINKVN